MLPLELGNFRWESRMVMNWWKYATVNRSRSEEWKLSRCWNSNDGVNSKIGIAIQETEQRMWRSVSTIRTAPVGGGTDFLCDMSDPLHDVLNGSIADCLVCFSWRQQQEMRESTVRNSFKTQANNQCDEVVWFRLPLCFDTLSKGVGRAGQSGNQISQQLPC